MSANYQVPHDLSGALSLLAQFGTKAIVIAGGTELVPHLREDAVCRECIVDIGQLGELRGVEETAGKRLRIGALTTCAELASSEVITSRAPVLAESARHVGGPQIRNVATIGGNIAGRCPRADLIPALLVLDAAVTVQSKAGTRRLSLEDYLANDNRPGELVTAIDCELAEKGAAFTRLAARKSLAPAIASVAVLLNRAGDEWNRVRIALGGVSRRVIRAHSAEKTLSDRNVDFASAAGAAAEAARNETAPESDSWASAWYRTQIIAVLVRRALVEAERQLAGI